MANVSSRLRTFPCTNVPDMPVMSRFFLVWPHRRNDAPLQFGRENQNVACQWWEGFAEMNLN